MSEAQSEAAKAAWARRKAEAASNPAPAQAVDGEEGAAEPGDTTRMPTVDHSERDSALEEIRKRREERAARGVDEDGEGAHETPNPDDEENQAADVSRETGTAAATPAPDAAAPATLVAAAPPVMVKVKIDGQESEVAQSEIEAHGSVAAYQINKAAENRLHKATEFQRQQAELTAKLQAQYEALRNPPVPKKSAVEVIREKIGQLQFGTPEEAATAIDEIIAAKMGPAIDPVKIQEQAMEGVVRNMAAQGFMGRAQDLITDRVSAQLAILTEQDMLTSQGKPSDWNKFYTDLETNLRSRLGRPTIADPSLPPANPSTNGSLAAKEARKLSIVAPPTVAASRAAIPEEQKPKTRTEVLAQIRRARGQDG